MKCGLSIWLCAALVCLFVTGATAFGIGIGDTVRVAANTNVRNGPGTNYPEITDPDYRDVAPAGTIGKVVAGPQSASGYTWWRVDFGPGLYVGWAVQDGLQVTASSQPAAASIALTLYVHEGSASGPLIAGARVTGQDGTGSSFDQTTNASGCVMIVGKPGKWRFTAAKDSYQPNSWPQDISSTCTRHAFLQKSSPTPSRLPNQPTPAAPTPADSQQPLADANRRASEINAEIERLALEYSVPPIVIQAICWNENKWVHIDPATGKPAKGPTGDFGLMQVTEREAAAFPQYADWQTNWKTNLRLAVRILLVKWSKNKVPEPAGKLILENWYYPIAWYNGYAGNAYDYVGRAYAFMRNAPVEVRQFCHGVDIGSPRLIDGWDVEKTVNEEGNKEYQLSQIVQAGGRIHQWNGKVGAALAYEDVTAIYLQSTSSQSESTLPLPTWREITSQTPAVAESAPQRDLTRRFSDPCGDKGGYRGWRGGEDKRHLGHDYNQPEGTAVAAIGQGVVYSVQTAVGGYGGRNPSIPGPMIWIRHTLLDGSVFYVQYGHVKPRAGLKKGDSVRTGDEIGVIIKYMDGQTPLPHLHLAVWYDPQQLEAAPTTNQDLSSWRKRLGTDDFHFGYGNVEALYRNPKGFIAFLTDNPSARRDDVNRHLGIPQTLVTQQQVRTQPSMSESAKPSPTEPTIRQTEGSKTGDAAVKQPQQTTGSKPTEQAQFRQLSAQEQTQAASLWNRVEAARKVMNRGLFGELNKRRMVEYCRRITKQFPGSEYAFKAKQTLSGLSEKDRQRYAITDQETDTPKK